MSRRAVAAACLAVSLGVVVAGCGSSGGSTTAATATTPATTTAPRVELTIYPVVNGVVVPRNVRVPETVAVAAAALHALGVAAPVAIAHGTATVDLPDATPVQTAEIVYTLTRFASVTRVDVGGRKGLTRDDESRYAPRILVDSPAAGADVPRSIRVVGTAQVFEATFVIELHENGATVARRTVTASAGAPERGTFSAVLHAPAPGPATVVAYERSAEDGTPLHRVSIPVRVRP